MQNFEVRFSNLMKARFPFVYIPTWEEDRVLKKIKKIAYDKYLIKTPRNVFTWKVTDGLMEEGSSKKEESTKNPLKALEFIESYDEPGIFILLDFHIFLGANNQRPDVQVIRKLRDLLVNLKMGQPRNIIFISPSLVLPEELQKDVTILDFELPNLEELNEHIFSEDNGKEGFITRNVIAGTVLDETNENEKERLIKAALGLTLHEAENAFARALVDDGKLDISDLDIILEEKSQIIKKIGILEFIESDVDIEDVGGLANLKKWLNKSEKLWLDSAKKYCLKSPNGLLITGVPGCGKSLVAKSISNMWQLPLLRLDVSRIFSGIIGSSEENMRKAIKVAEALSPSILWVDEIEKGFGGVGSSGDSGTSTRVFGTFLTWMQEKTKPVFVVATANNIEYLPPEFLRAGRFDRIFFVDLPTEMERREIFRTHLERRLIHPEAGKNFDLSQEKLEILSLSSEGFGGSEIEQVVIDALSEAHYEDRCLMFEDLQWCVNETVPLSITQEVQINKIRNWANEHNALSATSSEHRIGYEQKDKDIKKKPADNDVFKTRGGRTMDL